jgi:hypothetical protein
LGASIIFPEFPIKYYNNTDAGKPNNTCNKFKKGKINAVYCLEPKVQKM